MLDRFEQILGGPVATEEDKIRVTGLLRTVVLATIVTAGFAAIASMLAPLDPTNSLIFCGALILSCFAVLYLVRRGFLSLACLLLLSVQWVIVTVANVVTGGVHSPGFIGYTAIILTAGLLLGGRAGISFAGLSILAGLSMLTVEPYLEVSYPPQDAISFFIAATATFIVVAVLLHLATRSLSEALARARRHERALAETNRELEARTARVIKANADLEHLLYIIAHDLKEPLRSIEYFSNAVNARYASQLDDKGQDFLTRVSRASSRQRRLLDDIGVFAELRRDADAVVTTTAADALVQAALERLKSKVQASRAQITVAPHLPVLRARQNWGTEAVYQLVSNALQYTRDGATPEIEIWPYEGPEGVGLVVKDRGPGVAPEHAERIFRLFQRAVGREVEGTGAGLAIVHQIAELHGGRAWVRPRQHGGSAFIITFGPCVSNQEIDRNGKPTSGNSACGR